MINFEELKNKCMQHVICDVARISQPNEDGPMFFIIGFNRNTKDLEGKILINGQLQDFDYVEERVIASGYTEKELLESVKEYQRLCGLTMEQYLKELSNNNERI